MTSQTKPLEVHAYLSKFEDILFEIEYDHKDLLERQKLIKGHLDRVMAKANKLIEKKKEVRAVEYFFLLLGMLKKVVENEILKSTDTQYKTQGKELLQELFIDYDLPCSLKMCKILFESGNYDQVVYLSERIQAIDPQNRPAQEYIKSITEAEKNEEFRRLKDAKDLNTYVYEYSKIQSEREKKKKEIHQKMSKEHEQYGKNDPARSILHGLEILIKLLLVIPFILYKRICDPVCSVIYQGVLLPLYLTVIINIPIVAPIVRLTASWIDFTCHILINKLEKWSGQEKETQTRSGFEGIPIVKDLHEYSDLKRNKTNGGVNGRPKTQNGHTNCVK